MRTDALRVPRDTLYANRWFKVVKSGAFHFIEEAAPGNSAAILIRYMGHGTDMGRYVLVWHQRPAVGGRCLEIVRGGGQHGETAAECAMREAREETGYILRPADLVRLGAVRPNTAILAAPIHLFYGETQLRLVDTDGEAVSTRRAITPGLPDLGRCPGRGYAETSSRKARAVFARRAETAGLPDLGQRPRSGYAETSSRGARVDGCELLTADELVDRIATGAIDDGFTLAACLRAALKGLLPTPARISGRA